MTYQLYMESLKNASISYLTKIELLDYYENAIGEIVSSNIDGNININRQQGSRRSCSLSLIDVDKKYLPTEDSAFWYKRKFKVYIGVEKEGDVRWTPEGVFVTQSATVTSNNRNVSIEASDKWKELEDYKTDVAFIAKAGSMIAKMLRETLQMRIGGNYILDTTPPLIDSIFANTTLQADVKINAGESISSLFIDIASGYGADVYYDTDGHLVFSRKTESERYSGYERLGHQWEYTKLIEPRAEYDLEAHNVVTVYTNASNTAIVNVSATVQNKTAKSPLNVDSIGMRRLESKEIKYINGYSQAEMRRLCAEYGRSLLNQEALQKCSITFSSITIPHMDVDGTVGITDEYFGFDNDTFIVSSITMPLGKGEMQVSACNIIFLLGGETVG